LHESRLNLSQHKSLRALRFLASNFPTSQDDDRGLQCINALLLAIPPSSQLDVVIVYHGFEFYPSCATLRQGHAGCCGCHGCIETLRQLSVLSSAYLNRNFRLVLSVEASREMAWCTTRALELHVRAYQDGELRSLLSGSSIISTVPCFASGYFY
jgi:hypothetical protein